MEQKKPKIIDKGKQLTDEFKTFAFSGATLGAAVGIMMGAALNSVISSLVKDILTPPIAYLTSGIDFSNLYWVLDSRHFNSLADAQASNAAIIYYGNFINTFISFLITALVLFLLVKKITEWVQRTAKKDTKKAQEKK